MEFSQTENNLTKGQRPHKSKAAIAAFIFGILSIFLFPITYIVTVILSVVAYVKIKKSSGLLRGRWFAVSGLLIPILVLAPIVYVWHLDAEHVPNEFTGADLLKVKPENESSYEVLLQLCNRRYGTKEVSAIGLHSDDETLLYDLYRETLEDDISLEEVFVRASESSQAIEYLWDEARRGREIIQKLAEYDEVADLTNMVEDSPPEDISNLINLNKLYCLRCLSMVKSGSGEMALQELLQFDKVVRSLSIFSSLIVTKNVCLDLVAEDIKVINIALNESNFTPHDILQIASHYQPLTHQHVSMKNYIVGAYLARRKLEAKIISESNGVVGPMLKINSKNRYYYSFCKNMILKDEGKTASEYCELSVWPWKENRPKLYFSGDRAKEQFRRGSLYWWYNPVGCRILAFATQNIFPENMLQRRFEIQITDDLFQWVLARRMGQEGSLKARAYSDEYTVDLDKGLVFSVGPDGMPYTDDDIKLRIDPVVLGLK